MTYAIYLYNYHALNAVTLILPSLSPFNFVRRQIGVYLGQKGIIHTQEHFWNFSFSKRLLTSTLAVIFSDKFVLKKNQNYHIVIQNNALAEKFQLSALVEWKDWRQSGANLFCSIDIDLKTKRKPHYSSKDGVASRKKDVSRHIWALADMHGNKLSWVFFFYLILIFYKFIGYSKG